MCPQAQNLHPRLGVPRKFIQCAIPAVAWLVLIPSARAAVGNDTWASGGTANWNLSANWISGSQNKPPTTGDTLIFDATTGVTTLNNDLTNSAFNIAAITFNATAPAYTINGNAFTLTGGITNNSTNLQTISNNIILSNTVHNIAPTAGGGGIVLSGNISGAGSSSSITMAGTGTVTLSGNNTFSGGIALGGTNGRVLNIGSATALGSGAITTAPGVSPTLDNTSGSAVSVNNAYNIGNGATLTFTGTKDLSLGALGYTGTNASRTINVVNGTLAFNGATTEATAGSVLTKSGAGKLVLNGSFTGTGASFVTNGTLQLGSVSALGAAGNTVNMGASNNTASLAFATDTSVNAYKISVANLNPGTVQFISDRATSGAGITHTLGTLTSAASSGNVTFDFLAGSNVTGGQAAVAFGSVTAGTTGSGSIVLNPTTATVTMASMTGSATNSMTATVVLGGNSTGAITGGVSNGVGSGSNNGIVAITKSNSSTWTITGNSNYTGSTLINGGVLQANDGAGLSSSSFVQFNGGVLQSNGTSTFTRAVANSVSGSNFIWNSVGGGFSANGGKLMVTVGNNASTELAWGSSASVNTIVGTLMFGSATANAETELQNRINLSGATRTIDVAAGTGGDFATLSGVIRTTSGTAGITKTGNGTLVLSGNNTYTGTTTISAGNLSISSTAALGSTSGVNLANATALIYTGSAGNLTRDIIVTGGTGTIRNSGSGLLTLSGGLSKNGTTLTLGGGSSGITVSGVISGSSNNSDIVINGGTTTLANANTYNGPTSIINSGTLNANAAGALPTSTLSAVTINGSSTLALGANQSVASLSGTSGSTVNLNTNTLTVNGSSSTTYSGGISGTGNLVKNGSGTQTLAGATTFNGTTTVNSGTLQVAATGALGNSTVINVNGGSFLVTSENAVNDNAAINLGGGRVAVSGTFNETVGALTLSANSTIDFAGFVGTLRFSGVGSWATGAHLAIWNWSGTTQYGTQINNYGTPSNLVFTNNSILTSNLANISFYSDSGNSFVGSGFEVSGFSGGGSQIIAVPETETYFSAIALLAGVVIQYLRHRAKRKFWEGQPPAYPRMRRSATTVPSSPRLKLRAGGRRVPIEFSISNSAL